MSGWFAPGRIEVLGKHTDYAGGNVLVCAVNRGVTATVKPGRRGIEARSTAQEDAITLEPGVAVRLPAGHWGQYLNVVVDRLGANFGRLRPARLAIDADLPLASGMSSSSALVVASAMALAQFNGFDESEAWVAAIRDEVALAGYLACVENGSAFGALSGRAGVGTFGGSEDHTAMLCSKADHLGLFSFNPAALVERVRLPDDLAFVVAVSGVSAEKTGAAKDAYNQASRGVAELLARWNAAAGRGDANLAAAVESDPEAAAVIESLVADEPRLLARLRQFVAESTWIVPASVEALRAGDRAALGELVAASQRWAADGLDNQIPQTEALVEDGRRLGAVAASSFGAGFGGSVWALVDRDGADSFAAEWLAGYVRAHPEPGSRAATLVTRPAGPAHALAD